MDHLTTPAASKQQPQPHLGLVDMFEQLPIALHEVDLSGVRQILDALALPIDELEPTILADQNLSAKIMENIRFMTANQAAAKITGAKTPDEVVDRIPETLLPTTVRSIIKSFPQCLERGFDDVRTQIRAFDGTVKDVRVCVAIDKNHRDTWRRAYVPTSPLEAEDLSSRLSQMHDIFNAVLNGVVMCVSHLTAEGEFLRCVGSLLRRFNLADDELVGENIYDKYPPELHQEIKRGLSGETFNFLDSAIIRAEEGNNWYVSSYFLPATGSGAYLVSFDVTDLRTTQHKLEEQAKELKRSHEEMTQFAQVVSHDLREPIRTVSLFTELLATHLGDQIDDKTRHYLETIASNADRMGLLIADLSRYNHIRPQEFTQTVDLNAAARIAVANLGSAITEARADVTIEALPQITGHETWVVLLLQNLIANAIKYRNTNKPQVRVWSEPGEDETIVFVKDNGIGIAPQYHERIFEIFRRLHSRDQFSGTGMGLAICKKIVTQYGGKIWVESAEGAGSTFAFTLPTKQT